MTNELSPPETALSSQKRYHDLDALRAIAMLLGIVLHGALAYIPGIPWAVSDPDGSPGFKVMLALIHGFRMALFFCLSGFFTAMLWRRRGLAALAMHRFKRIVLPLLIGLITIIPLMNYVAKWSAGYAASAKTADAGEGATRMDIWTAAQLGDTDAIRKSIESGQDPNEPDPNFKSPPLVVAAFYHQTEAMQTLLDLGANINQPSGDGGTALHIGCFLGSADVVRYLVDAGADTSIRNSEGKTAADLLELDWGITSLVATSLGLNLERAKVEQGRQESAVVLNVAPPETATKEEARDALVGEWVVWLLFGSVFHHLWFLWFLCVLVAAFFVYAWLIRSLGIEHLPRFLISSPVRYLYLIPITMLPQALMQSEFGPGTSVGLFPMPQILLYYAVFFFFGAAYYDIQLHYPEDEQSRVGRRWWLTLPIALLVVFPIGLDCSTGLLGWTDGRLEPGMRKFLSVLLQSAYVWLMTFGSIGFFRYVFSNENRTMRYLSDSSYWLYVAHLPLIIAAQALVVSLPLPAIMKFVVVCGVVTGVLLVTYQYGVRYTPIGRLLNGPRKKPGPLNNSIGSVRVD